MSPVDVIVILPAPEFMRAPSAMVMVLAVLAKSPPFVLIAVVILILFAAFKLIAPPCVLSVSKIVRSLVLLVRLRLLAPPVDTPPELAKTVSAPVALICTAPVLAF